MLSSWENARHSTSIRHRQALAEYFGQPPEVLFAHQDIQLTTGSETPRLLVGHRTFRDAMITIVAEARDYLAIAGSRSRDAIYLQAIEEALHAHAELIHYRILFGPPHRVLLREHLLRLLELRDPRDRSLGVKTLHLGMLDDDGPERFFCASEHGAIVPIPSLTSADAFDSGVLLGPKTAERIIGHARQCYAAARRIENRSAVLALPVLQESSIQPDTGAET